MSFAPKPGCPLCSIVATAQHAPHNSPRSPSFPAGSTQPEVLWRDDNFTAYKEKANPVSSKGHIIIAFNLHVPSIYTLSSTDVGLLVNLRNLAHRLLTSLLSSESTTPAASLPAFRIGFITPPFKDTKIPVTDHLHAHAFIEPADLMGWWRGVAYGPLAWYAVDDLIAEIRESVSNNRVKSGYNDAASNPRPIDLVPNAGARSGTASGIETTEPGVFGDEGGRDVESGEGGLRPSDAHSRGGRELRRTSTADGEVQELLPPGSVPGSPLSPRSPAPLSPRSPRDSTASLNSTSSGSKEPTQSIPSLQV